MQRFYVKDSKVKKDTFSVRDVNIVYQLVKVLRTRIWDQIIIFNGEDSIDYLCEINDFAKKEIDLTLLEKIEKKSDLSIKINLFQWLPNKLDKQSIVKTVNYDVFQNYSKYELMKLNQRLLDIVTEKNKEIQKLNEENNKLKNHL